MGRHDIQADAKRVFKTITAGGAAILPGDIGYGACASSSDALQRLFVAKRRAPHKRHAMVGTYELHREVHVLGSQEQEIVDAITIDAGLPSPSSRPSTRIIRSWPQWNRPPAVRRDVRPADGVRP
ncbi:Sua5/YciO/YrdC/YwlC family protein [Streptomyces werraensis]|uniref:Sua5/YciO/YrdC/YwlC family protein n=1 Tax=Streptomyces werraensis TaxID=68284 RepID=UPI001CE33732